MADEPERRIVGALVAEIERQENDGNIITSILNTDGTMHIVGNVDMYLLARAILAEVEPPPAPAPAPKKPRLIEFDLPVRQTADLMEKPLRATWEVPMVPRNIGDVAITLVEVEAVSAQDAVSKALSIKPGHTWGKPTLKDNQ